MTSPSQAPATAPAAAARASAMAPEAMAERLKQGLGEAVVDAAIAFGQLTVTVAPEALPEAARLCKEVPELAFDFYSHNAGVDLGDEGFAVVTHLYSLTHQHHVQLRVVAPGGREAPKVPTLTHLYRGANWHEREVYDMFGIDFEGHPGLLPRILTVENFEGFPLRKDFLLSTREAKPWPGLKEPKEVGEEDGADATAAEAPVSADEKAKASQARAERARAKAAAMRAEKQAEREAAQAAGTGEATAAGEATAGAAPDAQAAAAERTAGGETGGEGAAKVAAAAGEPEPQTPSGAANIARTAIAKDAAAGAVGGDTAAGAPGDVAGADQPVHDPQAEAEVGEGAPATPSGAPGVEAEGRHGGAEEHGRSPDADVPAASPYDDRSHPPSEEEDERPEPSDTLDEAYRLEDGRSPATPDDETGGEDRRP